MRYKQLQTAARVALDSFDLVVDRLDQLGERADARGRKRELPAFVYAVTPTSSMLGLPDESDMARAYDYGSPAVRPRRARAPR